jgi:Zn finger protein HypA/HybF involved in hydrogenase expression
MHELGIVEELIEKIEREAKEKGAKKVRKIVVQIGKDSHIISQEAFCTGFSVLSKNTIVEEAEIVIELKEGDETVLSSIDLEI